MRKIQLAIEKRRFPQTIFIRCLNCKHIQIKEIIDQTKLRDNYTYFSNQTKDIENHFKKISYKHCKIL